MCGNLHFGPVSGLLTAVIYMHVLTTNKLPNKGSPNVNMDINRDLLVVYEITVA